jgi:hypothetical protein
MVRKGSPVRVRKRALSEAPQMRAFVVQDRGATGCPRSGQGSWAVFGPHPGPGCNAGFASEAGSPRLSRRGGGLRAASRLAARASRICCCAGTRGASCSSAITWRTSTPTVRAAGRKLRRLRQSYSRYGWPSAEANRNTSWLSGCCSVRRAARSSRSDKRSRTVRRPARPLPFSSPSATACSMSRLFRLTLRQRGATASCGRTPAYASTDTSRHAPPPGRARQL